MATSSLQIKLAAQNIAKQPLAEVTSGLKGLESAAKLPTSAFGNLAGAAVKIGGGVNPINMVGGALHGLAGAASAPIRGFEALLGGITKLGLGVFAIKQVASALTSLATGLTAGNAEFETYAVQFKVLLGDADLAKKRLADLEKFGAETPFELPEVVRADKILQAFGFHSEESAKRFGLSGEKIRRLAGDVAAGTGASFEEMSTYLGKFASGATGEVIMRMSELGITTRKELAEMGLEFDKAGSLLSPLDDAMKVLLTSMEKKYGGMMDAQSQTFAGMTSNLQDWIGQTKRALAAPLFEVLKEKLAGTLAVLSSPEMKKSVDAFANNLAIGVDKAVKAVDALIMAINPMAGIAKKVLPEVLNAFQELGSGIAGNADVQTAIHLLEGIGYSLGEVLKAALSGDWDTAWGKVQEAFTNWVLPLWGLVSTRLTELANNIMAWIVEKGPGIAEALLSWAGKFTSWIETDVIPQLKIKLDGYLAEIDKWVKAEQGNVEESFDKLSPAAIHWIAVAINEVPYKFFTFLDSVLKEIDAMAPEIEAGTRKLTPILVKWIGESGKQLVSEIDSYAVLTALNIAATLPERLGKVMLDIGWGMTKGLILGMGDLAGDMMKYITAEIKKIKIDIGPFHLSASGFYVDMPAMPTITLPSLPGFATGGVVPGPVGAATLAVVHGGETIMPARRGGAGRSLTINVSGNTILGDEESVARELARMLTPYLAQYVGI